MWEIAGPKIDRVERQQETDGIIAMPQVMAPWIELWTNDLLQRERQDVGGDSVVVDFDVGSPRSHNLAGRPHLV